MAAITLDTAKVKGDLQRVAEELEGFEQANVTWVEALGEASKKMSDIKAIQQTLAYGEAITKDTRETSKVVEEMIEQIDRYDAEFTEFRETSVNLDM